MAVLKIYTYGAPCLDRESEPIEKIDEEVHKLIDDMAETMYESEGIGLAAPQVGVNKRLFVMDTDWAERENGERVGKKNPQAYINPEITWESEVDDAMSEGCLSLPGIEGEVFRPIEVKMRWLDREGREHEEKLDEMMARCVQHERDHLDGILFIKRMPFVKRSLLAGKLRQLKKRQGAEEPAKA
ncbi:MAG: peptide deformylase [Candidatus Sumerlaeia bacterium]